MMNSFKQMRGFTLLKISSLFSAKKKKQDALSCKDVSEFSIQKVRNAFYTNICSFWINCKLLVLFLHAL